MLSGLMLEVDTLRLQVHLPRAFGTVLGSQSWSNDPLVYWLDQTDFIVLVYRDVTPHCCKMCLQAFGLERIACETIVGCRNQTIACWEPPEKCLCDKGCVTASPRIPRDPRALIELARWLPWTLVWKTPWPATVYSLRSSPLASRTPWHSRHVSSSRIVTHLARAFGSSDWGWELLQGAWREVVWGWWEAGAQGGQWQPWGGACRGWVHRVLRAWPRRQVRWMDLQGCRKILGGWQGGRRPACGSALLPRGCNSGGASCLKGRWQKRAQSQYVETHEQKK